MPLKPQYCNQCGAQVETRYVEDRRRQVCPSCDTIFYQNPLPVVSAVVLNRKRQVLLVKRKREPYRGMWCLPIGFAELDESIAQAALRELQEESGVEGEVRRLLGAESMVSDHYGEILVVTFEVRKTGGEAVAGDDAEAVGYFPIDALPELAFEPNLTAIRACAEAHREAWAIEDSFRQLQSDEGQEMLSDALVRFMRDHAAEVAERWTEDVRTNPTTPSYRRVDPERLKEGAVRALSQFTRWLGGEEGDYEVRDFYRSVGEQHRRRGFALDEVISSLALFRKHIWTFARSQGVWRRPIEVYRVLELDQRFVVFFDKAVYQAVKGYEKRQRLRKQGG